MQLLSAGEMSYASDVYSFGTIMYELLTFKDPFDDLLKSNVSPDAHSEATWRLQFHPISAQQLMYGFPIVAVGIGCILNAGLCETQLLQLVSEPQESIKLTGQMWQPSEPSDLEVAQLAQAVLCSLCISGGAPGAGASAASSDACIPPVAAQ